MFMKKALAIVLAAGFVVGSYATDARVVVMGGGNGGKSPAFYRDEVSIFKNPADISLYPNMLYGSYGWLDPGLKTEQYYYGNSYPQDPFFGAFLSHRLSEEENGPMVSFGAFLNRSDYILEDLFQAADGLTNKFGREAPLAKPVGKIDLIFGYDLGNGLAVGVGAYGAYQKKVEEKDIIDLTSVFKGTLGINWNLEQGLDLEASVNGGMITGIATVDGYYNEGYAVAADGEFFWRGDVRFFSAVPAINGSFVPQVSLEFMNLDKSNRLDLEGGVGINMNIDRGFFWAGVQGLYTSLDITAGNKGDEKNEASIGGRFSFGIERNIVWDWFLIRVGGQKEIRNVAVGNKVSSWVENSPEFGVENGQDGDLVSLGFGLNIDNRLRIDFVASEDLPYTFTNLVSGNKSHLFNRVSATYRF
jgi:hypothetical protein